MEGKRLYRSRKDRMICGVCGGIAKYFNIDPTLVRLAFVLISMGAGSGVLAYIVAAIIIPDAGMRCLLCQIGKEAEEFRILELISI